jgi:hypothetical protein
MVCNGKLLIPVFSLEASALPSTYAILARTNSLLRFKFMGEDLYIKLYRSRKPFVLMSGETNPDYKLQILDVALKACKVKVDSGSIVNHIKTIEVTPAKYFFNRREIKKNTIAKRQWILMGQHVLHQTFPSSDRVNIPNKW